jgi:hypothetical protein
VPIREAVQAYPAIAERAFLSRWNRDGTTLISTPVIKGETKAKNISEQQQV